MKTRLKIFQSTPSVGRATGRVFECPDYTEISIHALRGEGDKKNITIRKTRYNFNPRPPWGGRQASSSSHLYPSSISIHALRGEGDHCITSFLYYDCGISIHALRGEGDYCHSSDKKHDSCISIHALRGEGDKITNATKRAAVNFNPRPPWGGRRRRAVQNRWHMYFNPRPPWGGRQGNQKSASPHSVFQSTPSVGRATRSRRQCPTDRPYFNPRPPWGGRPGADLNRRAHRVFQSTPSVGRATLASSNNCNKSVLFQSTPSVGRATPRKRERATNRHISIHALRGEGDVCSFISKQRYIYFNPRPPWGGRHIQATIYLSSNISIHALRGEGDDFWIMSTVSASLFQSTPSVGRATAIVGTLTICLSFQSTPSVGRATSPCCSQWSHSVHFNPRPPWGGRRIFYLVMYSIQSFQSTPSVGRATFQHRRHRSVFRNFNPRPPWGGRPLHYTKGRTPKSRISIHALRGEGDNRMKRTYIL